MNTTTTPKLTNNEITTLCLITFELDGQDEGFSTLEVKDVKLPNMNMKQMGGIISSLVKKNLIEIEEWDGQNTKYFIHIVK